MRLRFGPIIIERFRQENLGLIWSIILKLTLSNYSFSVRTVLVADCCEQCTETFGFHKCILRIGYLKILKKERTRIEVTKRFSISQ